MVKINFGKWSMNPKDKILTVSDELETLVLAHAWLETSIDITVHIRTSRATDSHRLPRNHASQGNGKHLNKQYLVKK